jgi:hypothetical protein
MDNDKPNVKRSLLKTSMNPQRALGMALAAGLMVGLTACTNILETPKTAVYLSEQFEGDETFSRLFDGNAQQVCEAARRTLLSQGYVIQLAQTESVRATKRFQPNGDSHVEIAFTVVCVSDAHMQTTATAFVSAQQDTYTLKKSANSANIGVSALGSISVPLPSSSDSLVKVGSETIPAGEFYDRFFSLTHRMLREVVGPEG